MRLWSYNVGAEDPIIYPMQLDNIATHNVVSSHVSANEMDTMENTTTIEIKQHWNKNKTADRDTSRPKNCQGFLSLFAESKTKF